MNAFDGNAMSSESNYSHVSGYGGESVFEPQKRRSRREDKRFDVSIPPTATSGEDGWAQVEFELARPHIFSAMVHRLFWTAVICLIASLTTSLLAMLDGNKSVGIVGAFLMVAAFVFGLFWIQQVNREHSTKER